MASGRMIKRELVTSRKFNIDLKTDLSRVAYCLMIPFTDINGRLDGEPELIKGIVFPIRQDVSFDDVTAVLTDLSESGLIKWYEVDNRKYIEITRFHDFQTLRKDREADGSIPPPGQPITPPEKPVFVDDKPKPEPEKKKRETFKPPSIEDVKDYAEKMNYANLNAPMFHAHYESNGWKVGPNKMKSWKAAVTKWHFNNFDIPSTNNIKPFEANTQPGLSPAGRVKFEEEA